MQIKDKVILITGGAVRVGRCISLEMAHAGADIFCHYYSSEQEASSLKREIESFGARITLLKGNLSKKSVPETLIKKVIRKRGKIDVLINNAALFYKTPFGTVTDDQWDDLFNLNLKAAFFCAQSAGQIMLKQGSGKIINIGDPSGESPWPSFIPYGLTKGGIISMTKALAKALAPNIQVNCINPGPVLIPEHYSEEEKNRAVQATLLKREGSAKDIANAVKFLLEGSDYITGISLNVDGGRSVG